MAHWVAALPAAAVGAGEMQEVEVAGQRVVVACSGGRWHAFAALCPHASAPLVEGDLRAAWVICPLHAYRFELATGRCLKPRDGPRLRLFPMEERGGMLWLRVEG